MSQKDRKINIENVPFQVSDIVDKLLQGKDKEHIRENYRVRLIDIRDYINQSLDSYDEALKQRNFIKK